MTVTDKPGLEAFEMAMPVATHSPFWTLDLEDRMNVAINYDPYPQSHLASRPMDINLAGPLSASNDNNRNHPEEESWSSGSSTPSEAANRICANCQTTQTPFWRRAGDGQFFCNACGLYLRAHNKMRPIALQMTRQSKRIKSRVDMCSNCSAKDTPLWRRLASGETVCNACGLYYKLHGTHRPIGSYKVTSAGKRPRVILPKYMSGDTWHQYLPSDMATKKEDDEMGTIGDQQRNDALGNNGNFELVQFSMFASPANPFFNILPSYSSPTVAANSFQTLSNRIANSMDTLDDSMRWFSNSCLDGSLTGPSH